MNAFEGNRAETTTMLRVTREFMKAHDLADVTIVADAGMVSDANKRALETEGLSFILGARVPDIPYVVKKWRQNHPDAEIPDAHVFAQPWPAARSDQRRDQILNYQYRADRSPANPARDRRASRQGREGSRGQGLGEAQQVHQRHRRHEEAVQTSPSAPAA